MEISGLERLKVNTVEAIEDAQASLGALASVVDEEYSDSDIIGVYADVAADFQAVTVALLRQLSACGRVPQAERSID